MTTNQTKYTNGERHALTLAALTLTLSHGWERELIWL